MTYHLYIKKCMKTFKLIFFLPIFFCAIGCSITNKPFKNHAPSQLTETQKQELSLQIVEMSERDSKYRSIVSLGTLNEEIIERDKEFRKTASLEDYLVFLKSVKKDIAKSQIDSLWALQHALDYENYLKIKTLITQFGYPSSERVGTKGDKLFPILLHPPIEIPAQTYLNEMSKILLPEVKANRMDAISFAMFYDNIKTKILKEPQLYGTNKPFHQTKGIMGLPVISDIKKTNKARVKIGLKELNKGEYELKNK